jgi:hypothetical protein
MNPGDEHLLTGLERFMRLTDSQSTVGFRRDWPVFFPETFWKRDLEQKPPGVIHSDAVPQLPVVPMWKAYQDVLLEAWRHRFPMSDTVRLIVAPVSQEFDALSSVTESPYQRAVLLVAMESWRARFCFLCGQPFAADKGASKFCSPACYAESRLNTKKRWWAEQGSERRRLQQSKKKPTKRRKL